MHLPIYRDELVAQLRRMGVDRNEELINIAYRLSDIILSAEKLPSETAEQTVLMLNAILWIVALLELSPSRENSDHFIRNFKLRHGRWFPFYFDYPIDETEDVLLKLGYCLIEPTLFADSGEVFL